MSDAPTDDQAASADRTGRLTYDRAYEVLGLHAGVDRKKVRSVYRKLALRLHPDLHPGDEGGHQRFKQITAAYQLLESRFRLDDLDPNAGACHRCGVYASLLVGLDRNRYCRNCLLSLNRARLLPAAPIVVVTCGFSIVSLIVATVLLVLQIVTQRPAYGLWALACGALMLVSLAATAVSVVYVIHKKPYGRS